MFRHRTRFSESLLEGDGKGEWGQEYKEKLLSLHVNLLNKKDNKRHYYGGEVRDDNNKCGETQENISKTVYYL